MSQEAYEKAMTELDEIEKSQTEGTDGLEELTKSLEEELGEDLQKSEDKDDDDEGSEPEGEKFGKSYCEEFDEELVKASEAYASLEKSVHDSVGALQGQIDSLTKSMGALMNLNIKQAKVISGLAKAIPEISALTKSVKNIGSQPTIPNKAVLGMSRKEEIHPLAKSVSEINDLLATAISKGEIDSRHLSVFGTYKDINRLPLEVRTLIGI